MADDPTAMSQASRSAALIILLAFFAFAALMTWRAIGSTPENWARLLTIFATIQSLGFAAAGVLLGRTVGAPDREALQEARATRALAEQRFNDEVRRARAVADDVARDLDEAEATIAAPGRSVADPLPSLGRARARLSALAPAEGARP